MRTLPPIIASILFAFSAAADVTIAWDASPPEDQITKYTVYQATAAAGPFVAVANTQATSARLLFAPGVGFWYVTAANVTGESAPSETAHTPAVATTGRTPRIVSWANGVMTLAWDANPAVEEITSYVVYLSSAATGPFTAAATSTGLTAGVALSPGTWYFRIAPRNFWGEGPASATITMRVTPGAVKNVKVIR